MLESFLASETEGRFCGLANDTMAVGDVMIAVGITHIEIPTARKALLHRAGFGEPDRTAENHDG